MTQDHLNLLGQRLEAVMSFMQQRSAELFLPPSAYVSSDAPAAAPRAPGAALAAAAAAAGGGGV